MTVFGVECNGVETCDESAGGNSPSIVGVLDFATGVYDPTYTNSLSSYTPEYIVFVSWDPGSNTLFELTQGRVLVYPSAIDD